MSVIDGDGYDPAGKSAAEIERDISETRAELGATLDALERRLQPRYLLELGMYTLRDKMEKNGDRIGDTLRSNPVPLALIGAGLGWFIMSRFERPAQIVRDVGDRLTQAARQMSDGVLRRQDQDVAALAGDFASSGEEMAGYAYARTKPRVAATAAAAVETAGRARTRLLQAVAQDPLALGIVGLFAGLALALVLPRSETEERLIGPVRRQLRDRAGAVGREAVERAQSAAEQAVDSAAEALKSSGE